MLIIFFTLTAIGIYLILADIFKISRLKKKVTLVNLTKRNRKKKNTKSLEVLLLEYATKLSKYIKLNEYNKEKLSMILRSAQIKVSPEVYVADVYIKTGIMVFISAIVFFIAPLLSIVFLVISVVVYIKEYGKAEEILRKKKAKIECELPRFAMTIEQELETDRDVLRILENYQKYSNSSNLGSELEITVADMRSGSYEEALRRFETRIGSSALSEVIRGLTGVLNGNDETLYFRVLANSLAELEYQRLRGIALKRPQKIKKYSAIMLGCMMLIYAVVLGHEIVNGISNMF
ncbi:secretion protein F [Romboutsia sp. 1001216sp1]|uniref:secretion protein F n=1 Tax=unclassified Romboutsia TaxID=2626894 RepID=UPI00189D9D77|nr:MULTISPECIES: secretion protein F [unclassified Romboutsia]MDB8803196.1 secretion protein F [Romboutsia sp. 1001216sp1]MDB8814555.1 secretion protein F [Romboutsia sp. 1001216sp1]